MIYLIIFSIWAIGHIILTQIQLNNYAVMIEAYKRKDEVQKELLEYAEEANRELHKSFKKGE